MLLTIGVGVHSTLGGGGKTFLPENMKIWNINRMPEFYMIFAHKYFFPNLGATAPSAPPHPSPKPMFLTVKHDDCQTLNDCNLSTGDVFICSCRQLNWSLVLCRLPRRHTRPRRKVYCHFALLLLFGTFYIINSVADWQFSACSVSNTIIRGNLCQLGLTEAENRQIC